MKVTCFHLMPYNALDLDAARDYKSSWVTLPNSLYDPEQGHKIYERYLNELIRAEELGFDGIGVNEHHQTSYGMIASPIVLASILARQTKRVKIAILGSALPLRDHPITLAEEHAMIDVISGGRLISGFVRGIGAEYHSFGVNPTYSHERYQEAHDLIVEAWTKDGPFPFHGKHYHVNYVNLWPKPFQKPHPPIWVPSQGSKETIDWAAHPERRYTYLQTFSPAKVVGKFLNMYRERAEEYGYTALDSALGWNVPIYVSDTDQSARKEFKEHYVNFRTYFLRMPKEYLLPPGYTSRESLKAIAIAKADARKELSFEEVIESGLVIVGSADTVRERLTEYWKEFRFGHLLPLLQLATMPAEMTARNMELFATKVMPHLQALGESETSNATETVQ